MALLLIVAALPEVSAQNDSLKAQNDLLKEQNDLLKAQNDLLKAQNDLLKAQKDSLKAQKDSLKANELTIGLEFLTHGEVCRGGLPKQKDEAKVVDDKANFLLGRTRLAVGYQRKGLEARAVIQNTAIWGMKNNMDLALYEGWVKMTLKNGLFAQVGRMVLSYDDERIIGPDDWAMASMSHDVLRLGYEGHGHRVHGILAYNQNKDNTKSGTFYDDGAQPYKTMQTLWYHYELPKYPLGASLLFMNIGLQAGTEQENPHTEYQQLLGAYIKWSPKIMTVEGSYYRQFGRNEYCAKVDAWMASLKATVTPSRYYSIEAGYDHLSGDDYMAVPQPGMIGLPRHEVFKGFAPLYGSHHDFYGVMDYFYKSAYLNGFTPGLQNAFVGGYFNPTSKLTIHAAYHYMAVATKLQGLDKTLGHDIELEASYQFTKDISLSLGYTYMIGTETMNRLKQGAEDKHVRWGWFSLSISPRLFTFKW